MRKLLGYPLIASLTLAFLLVSRLASAQGAATLQEARASETVVFSFFEHCCEGAWYSPAPGAPAVGGAVRLPCPGSDTDPRGFVRPLSQNFLLEDGRPASRAFETHPAWVDDGSIWGQFDLAQFGVALQVGDRLVGEVGLLHGAGAGKVRFSILFGQDPSKPEYVLTQVEDSYDGQVRPISVGLNSLVGRSGFLILHVDAMGSSGQDWAAWVDPRIERAATPTPTDTPTSTATATFTATPTATPTSMPTPTDTPTPTSVPTATHTPTAVSVATFTPMPTGVPTPTETATPSEAKWITMLKTPEEPKLGDRVTIYVEAYSPARVRWIEIWVNGRGVKRCFLSNTCTYVTPPLIGDILAGALAIDDDFDVPLTGDVPSNVAEWTQRAPVGEPWWFDDDDGDGEVNITDNCIDSRNPDQADADEDGVGDACDECNLYALCPETSGEFWNYCDFGGGGARELFEYEEGTHYFDDYQQYGLIADSGCGCIDSDRHFGYGLNYFEQGAVLEEAVEWEARLFEMTGRCRASSDCEVFSYDQCSGNTLTEYYCDSDGPGSTTVECPAGCSSGACVCPDTDGGRDYYNRGTVAGDTDECIDATYLRERFCGGIDESGNVIAGSEVVACPYGCTNGACGCEDSDGGINFDQRGTIGINEDYCNCDGCPGDTSLHEYYGDPTEERCYVRSTSHTCEGLCRDGMCVAPTCDDGVRNQAEELIDCGGPCVPCSVVEVRGRILYEDADELGTTSAGFLPVRLGRFKIKGELETVTQLTDTNGRFYLLLPRTGNVGKQIHIRLGGCGLYNGGFNYAVKIANDLDFCNRYVRWDSDPVGIPEEGHIDFGDLRIGMVDCLDFEGANRGAAMWALDDPCRRGVCQRRFSSFCGGSAYFNIADAVLTAREYADAHRDDDDSIGRVTVEFPDGDWANYTNFYELIKLSRDFGYSDATVVHEYGHHLQKRISQRDWYMGDQEHDLCTDKDHSGFAWREGFAEYFGTIVPHHNTAILTGRNVWEAGAEGQCGCPRSATDIECTVVAVLWDLVDEVGPDFPDSINEWFDTTSGYEDLIFSIFDRELDEMFLSPGLCSFVNAWDCRLSGAERDAIDALLAHYNVGCDRGCD